MANVSSQNLVWKPGDQFIQCDCELNPDEGGQVSGFDVWLCARSSHISINVHVPHCSIIILLKTPVFARQ